MAHLAGTPQQKTGEADEGERRGGDRNGDRGFRPRHSSAPPYLHAFSSTELSRDSIPVRRSSILPRRALISTRRSSRRLFIVSMALPFTHAARNIEAIMG